MHPTLLDGLKDLGYARPTPIQADAIPPAMLGRDILASAMTGSGKTAAFLLPILHLLIAKPRGTTRALILTPTRELAQQIVEDLDDLATHTALTGAAVYGGVKPGPQEHAFRRGVDVIVATPGRLMDHARFGYAKMPGIEILVLDEADRMLDMGFLPEIRKILRMLPPKRQTLFFSATMPAPIAVLAQEMLNKPATINLARIAAPAVGITQAVYPVQQDLKTSLLLHLLEHGDIDQALVFTRTKHRADRLARSLQAEGVKAAQIHGNRSQAQRTQALAGFKAGRYRVLVATDIAARGIDVEELGHVVNFDVPRAPEDYIHRIGRTGRAEATGDAFTFFSHEEETELKRIERTLGKRLPRVTVPDFDYRAKPAPSVSAERSHAPASRSAANNGRGGGGASSRGSVPVRVTRSYPSGDAPRRAAPAARPAREYEDAPSRSKPARPGLLGEPMKSRPPRPAGGGPHRSTAGTPRAAEGSGPREFGTRNGGARKTGARKAGRPPQRSR